MHSLSIFGTSSDAGKSTIAFALSIILQQQGIKIAPFKAQNVSNNSQVTDEGGEIAVAQYFTAKALGLYTSPDMNPILLKSGPKSQAHVIVNGYSLSEKNVQTYFNDLDSLKPIVSNSFRKLQKKYDCIIAEGAGSPVELNLMDKDLSNLFIAQEFQTKIILVADIERGGVFASIYGVYKLLPKQLRSNVIGVIINKFQGDSKLFDNGVKIIEKKFKLPVLGVIPYTPFNLAFEDIESLKNYSQNLENSIIKVGIIQFPHISNFTDFEPLIADPQLEVFFLTTLQQIKECDLIILPGSKRVVDDLHWLYQKNFSQYLCNSSQMIFGICGGYEMMHEKILDPKQIESNQKKTRALGLFEGEVIFKRKKRLRKTTYKLFDLKVQGYEIHNAVAKKISQKKKNIYGSFIHGIFENDTLRYKIFSKINQDYNGYNFKKYKKKTIQTFTSKIEENVDIEKIMRALND